MRDNPILFNMLKQKVYNEFRRSFPSYIPLLKLIDIKNFRWQLYWLWEHLINSLITINTDAYHPRVYIKKVPAL